MSLLRVMIATMALRLTDGIVLFLGFYNDVVTLESEDMCFDEFIEWLKHFMYCHYEDYRVVDVFGSPNIIFCRLN